MVVTNTIKTAIKSAALAEFDSMTHMGFGTGTATPSGADTDLTTPIVRVAFDETPVKNVSAGTYDFSALLGLTEGNTNDLAEMGIFTSSSGGDMGVKKLLSTIVAKSASVELSVGLRVTVTVS